ncbi:GGDEF domain-containing protein [Campylobacter pinnipediorum]|uniref:GGDEF domain-containing protein n=1 Tax=Campylobacter pinnipediorum TaxID=1965231 RepID=UPI0009AE298C|nr:GGDEF domain-containing protein [Campylobacter pinnipediorum]
MSRSLTLTKDLYSKIEYILRITNILAFAAHASYFVIFLIMEQYILVTVNSFSIIIYLFIQAAYTNPPNNSKILLTLFQFEIMIHALICIMVLGWGYGFEMIFITFIITIFFVETSYKKVTYFLTFIQFVLFIICCLKFYDIAAKNTFWKDFCFIYNFIIMSFLAMVLSYMLEISNQVAYLNAQREKENIKNISNQDPLTKLSNRHSLQDFIKKYLSKNKQFILVLSDIDDFKKANDFYGHNVGDSILVHISSLLKNILREDDFLCRWGGEEFLIIMLDIDKNSALNVIKRAKNILNTTFVKHGDYEIKTTMTFGAVYHDKDEEFDIETMIKKADDLMYKGKKTGKNKIIYDFK